MESTALRNSSTSSLLMTRSIATSPHARNASSAADKVAASRAPFSLSPFVGTITSELALHGPPLCHRQAHAVGWLMTGATAMGCCQLHQCEDTAPKVVETTTRMAVLNEPAIATGNAAKLVVSSRWIACLRRGKFSAGTRRSGTAKHAAADKKGDPGRGKVHKQSQQLN